PHPWRDILRTKIIKHQYLCIFDGIELFVCRAVLEAGFQITDDLRHIDDHGRDGFLLQFIGNASKQIGFPYAETPVYIKPFCISTFADSLAPGYRFTDDLLTVGVGVEKDCVKCGILHIFRHVIGFYHSFTLPECLLFPLIRTYRIDNMYPSAPHVYRWCTTFRMIDTVCKG